MDKFSLEQIQVFGFKHVNDGGDYYYELVLGKDYWNDDFIYAEEVGNNEYGVYDGRTNAPLSYEQVISIIKEMEG